MILPTKYLDLQVSVLRLAAFILEELAREPIVKLPDLAARVEEFAGERARFNFFPTLNLMFLAGQLDYDISGDLIVAPSSRLTEVK
jgi:hypothetical protein